MYILTIKFYASRIRVQLAPDQLQQGCFTGTTGAHYCGNALAWDIHVDTINYHALTTAEFHAADFDQCVAQVGYLGCLLIVGSYFYYLGGYCMRLLRLMHQLHAAITPLFYDLIPAHISVIFTTR